MTVFAIFSFLRFRNIRKAYSKHFQNYIYETDIASVAQQSTT